MEKFTGEIDGKALALFIQTKRLERARLDAKADEKRALILAYLRHATKQ